MHSNNTHYSKAKAPILEAYQREVITDCPDHMSWQVTNIIKGVPPVPNIVIQHQRRWKMESTALLEQSGSLIISSKTNLYIHLCTIRTINWCLTLLNHIVSYSTAWFLRNLSWLCLYRTVLASASEDTAFSPLIQDQSAPLELCAHPTSVEWQMLALVWASYAEYTNIRLPIILTSNP